MRMTSKLMGQIILIEKRAKNGHVAKGGKWVSLFFVFRFSPMDGAAHTVERQMKSHVWNWISVPRFRLPMDNASPTSAAYEPYKPLLLPHQQCPSNRWFFMHQSSAALAMMTTMILSSCLLVCLRVMISLRRHFIARSTFYCLRVQ